MRGQLPPRVDRRRVGSVLSVLHDDACDVRDADGDAAILRADQKYRIQEKCSFAHSRVHRFYGYWKATLGGSLVDRHHRWFIGQWWLGFDV